ncbi:MULTISPECIES: MarR family winged helix-turn-helix transcriptional regulator [Sphingomonas]|jgi:DNA-binding MarR family transcriptional regulator|uniref:MarR family winged helix-turn-helix transcriptional regulator n=1 Tax=Sphingomonas TaxID=13687 RepID=UPI001AEDAC00|nr:MULTISPECIES: MarR family winged helix-turn-helix transcriptional regulator [Sphingomonas]
MGEPRLVLDEFLPFRLSVTSNLVSGLIARAYQSLFGLSIPEWRLITVIAESGGITQQAIGARTRMDKVTVSRAAIALVERGLLARQDNPDDRRSHLLDLTEAGRALYAAVAPKALDLEARIFSRFPRDEVAAFSDMLHRIEAFALDQEKNG